MLRLALIACSSLKPELEALTTLRENALTLRFMPLGLHQQPASFLREALQTAVNEAENADAVALAYGLCNRGILGLLARTLPVAIPRAHDCIALLLGSRQRYLAELEAQPGTYFQSPGWMTNAPKFDVRPPDFTFGPNARISRDVLVRRYGEDNADYLLDAFREMLGHYERLAYIATPAATGAHHEAEARRIAAERRWRFERLNGEPGWLMRLLQGEWNEDEFVVLRPGQRLAACHDGRLICAEPA